MYTTGRIENHNGIPIFVPNDTFSLNEKDCYVSYNTHDIEYYGCDTTALVRMDSVNPTKFLILNGNHTKEYYKLKNYKDCVEYFKNHLDQKNKMSENWNEEIIIDANGKATIKKLTDL